MIKQIDVTINQAVKSISTWVASEKHPTLQQSWETFAVPLSLSLKWYNLFLKTRKMGRYPGLLIMGAVVYFRFSWLEFMNEKNLKRERTFCEGPHGYRRPFSDVSPPDEHLLMLLSWFIRRTVRIYIIRMPQKYNSFCQQFSMHIYKAKVFCSIKPFD